MLHEQQLYGICWNRVLRVVACVLALTGAGTVSAQDGGSMRAQLANGDALVLSVSGIHENLAFTTVEFNTSGIVVNAACAAEGPR